MTEDYWSPEPIWQEAHVLASGPSLTREVIERLRGKNVIAVNSTVLSAPWAPVWYFSDPEVVFTQRRSTEPRISADGTNMVEFLTEFPGLVVTASRRVKKALDKVRLVKVECARDFPKAGSIRTGRSSGQTAIALAIGMGASAVYLHGFDMRAVDGREHHHREYDGRRRDPTIYDQHFIPAFAGWNDAARRAGVTILNATPGSALKEFPTFYMETAQ